MKKTLRKILSLICVISIVLSLNVVPVKASSGSGTGILEITYDGASPKEHQALTMTVDSVASQSPLQGFCVGWNFTFSGSSGSVSVYVPISSVNTSGGTRSYTFPLTNGWLKDYTGIAGGKSIRDLVTNKTLYDSITKAGCSVHADARIRKYSYSSSTYTVLNTYANSKAEIDSNFSEFSSIFKTNTKNDYFDLNKTLATEPPPTPNVIITSPQNGITVTQGTTVVFSGVGTGVHHMAGYVDGNYIDQQLNPSEDIAKQMTYLTVVTLDEVRDYTFQVKGRNTASGTDPYTVLKSSSINVVHVVPGANKNGTVIIKCVDQQSNTVIQSNARTNITFGDSITETRPTIDGYTFQGSQVSYGNVKSSLSSDISQTVTLDSGNTNATIYFYYRKTVKQLIPDKPEPPTTPQYHWWILSAKHFGSDFDQSIDNTKKMPAFSYSKTGTFAPTITDELEAGNQYSYSSDNIFPSLKTVRNADGTLNIDASGSYAMVNGKRYDIGKMYSKSSAPGLDYGIYVEIDDCLSFTQYAWYKGKYDVLQQDWNKLSKVDWGYALDFGGYQEYHFPRKDGTGFNMIDMFSMAYSIFKQKSVDNDAWTGFVAEDEISKYPLLKDKINLNRFVYFNMDDSEALTNAPSYRLTLILYTPDGKYNAITKIMTK